MSIVPLVVLVSVSAATSPTMSAPAASSRRVPRLLIFDLDACLWTPEMFELSSAPTVYDAKAGGMRAGGDVVRLFPGALAVLRRVLHDRASIGGPDLQVAVASSTTCPDWAQTCLENIVVDEATGTTVAQLVSYRQIFPGNKGRTHVPNIAKESGVDFASMIFWDDCIYGDNCGDVARNCDGIVCVRTPSGMTEELFEHGLKAFAAGRTGVV